MAPRNVRLVDGAGGQHPVELAYQGLDHRGMHVWVATAITPLVSVAGLEVEIMPPRTTVRMSVGPP